MIDRLETCRVYRATIPLSFLQILDLYTVPTRFSESLKDKNWMCELCMFPKSGHILAIYQPCGLNYLSLQYYISYHYKNINLESHLEQSTTSIYS